MSFYVTARPGPEYSKYAGAAVLAPDNSQQSDMRGWPELSSTLTILYLMIKAIRLWVLFIF